MSLAEIAPEIAKDTGTARGGRWFWVREFLRGFHDDVADASEPDGAHRTGVGGDGGARLGLGARRGG